ncbi:BamA/TamA family outer membrane protein [Dyadobacter psychrotolerans]|uniref:Bacterial surface antigen (D15) domain-containing protein n=1 Tax=Dyadobacter psychrotolerans TaxID=2541721 RepID=A0A4R5DRZ8_9BACT|nr:BamA/TamA family outer membrane protein [Dyadobacter psychrotolerans]TDE13875.1 hypothetical protein E0F88_18485 [Dyadobacter psychrotolerans]
MSKAYFSTFCLLLCATALFAQQNAPANDPGYVIARTLKDSVPKPLKTEEVDIMDVLRGIGKKKEAGQKIKVQRKVLYSFVPAIGYTLSTGFVGLFSANAAFYLSDSATTNISSVSTSFNYSQYHQITVPVQANIWTRDNGYNIIIDWRYFKYPQDTYGLGAHSLEENADKLNYSHIRLHQSVLKKISGSFYLGFGYMLDKRWKIKQEGSNEDVTAYGLASKSVSSGFLANVLYDSRKNSINPQGGFYANARYRNNLKALGSNTNWQSMVLEFRKYINFPAGSRNTLALWNFNWLTLDGKPPYLDLPSTSWDPSNNTGRGYIQGRFRSPDMLYFETEYRFSLTRNGLLGGVVFGNAQSFSNWPSSKFDRVIPGAGLGLRVKVNKASRTNIAIDYGFGVKGSRGLFVNLGEVF